MQSALGYPISRFILGAVAAAVVVADGIVLIGLTSTIPGSAVPVRAPVTAQTQVPATPTSSAAPAAPPPVAATPTTTAHPPPNKSGAGGGGAVGHQIPAPKIKSPFQDRCRSGQIPAWLCRGLPS
jgi:hypothetical protein